MKIRNFVLFVFASLMMLGTNAVAQNSAEQIVDNLSNYYSNRKKVYTIDDETQWFAYCSQQFGSDPSATISKLETYIEPLLDGEEGTHGMAKAVGVQGLIHRYYAIKNFNSSTDASKDKIESAWLSIEKKFQTFLDEYYEYQYRNGGSMVIIVSEATVSQLQECHQKLWESLNSNDKPAAIAKLLPLIDREISKAQRSANTSKVRAAATALKAEIRKYTTTLGSKCTDVHLQNIKELLTNMNREM